MAFALMWMANNSPSGNQLCDECVENWTDNKTIWRVEGRSGEMTEIVTFELGLKE